MLESIANKNNKLNEDNNLLVIDRQWEIFLSSDKKISNCYVNIENSIKNISRSNAPYFSNFDIIDKNGVNVAGRNIGYFYNIFENTILLTFAPLSGLDDEEKIKRCEIERDIDKILSGLIIDNGLGFLFIFNGKNKKIVYHQKEGKHIQNEKCIYTAIESILTGEGYIDSTKPVEYLCEEKKYKSYTRYFKGFDWYFSVSVPESIFDKKDNSLVFSLAIAIILIAFFSIIFFGFIISNFIEPLLFLSKKMKNVHNHDFTSNDHSALLDGLPVESHNEAGQLSETFSFMIEKLSANIKNLVEITAAKERMQSDLNVARKIQLEAVPKDFSEPKQKSVDIHAILRPAREVGGDLYDFFFIDKDHLCFTVGDVADKGVAAALFMFWAKKVIKNCYTVNIKSFSPANVMNVLNDVLCKDNTSATFITLFIGILNVRTGELRYANGGHAPPPIFMDCGGGQPKYKKDRSGPAVGIAPEKQYKDFTEMLQSGGAVFICTDGVTEAMDEKEELFGEIQLMSNFEKIKDKSCEDVVEGILHEVKRHAGDAQQSDDIAMLMIRWIGK